MKTPKQFNHINKLMIRVERLRESRNRLQEQLTQTDALLADCEVEWADLQKDLSTIFFGRTSLGEARVNDPKKSKRRKKKKRTTRASRKSFAAKKASSKGRCSLETRAEIRAAAKKRDKKLISVLKKAKVAKSIHELHKAVKNGSISQMQVSLRRMKKLVKSSGAGKATRYTLKGKK
jgi:hypothetical protein